jgi:hypothetical protein
MSNKVLWKDGTFQATLDSMIETELVYDNNSEDETTYIESVGNTSSANMTTCWDLTTSQVATSIKIRLFFTHYGRYTLDGSNNGTTWTTLVSNTAFGPVYGSSGTWATFTINVNGTYRYWRLSIVDTNAYFVPNIKTIRVGDLRIYNGSVAYGGGGGENIVAEANRTFGLNGTASGGEFVLGSTNGAITFTYRANVYPEYRAEAFYTMYVWGTATIPPRAIGAISFSGLADWNERYYAKAIGNLQLSGTADHMRVKELVIQPSSEVRGLGKIPLRLTLSGPATSHFYADVTTAHATYIKVPNYVFVQKGATTKDFDVDALASDYQIDGVISVNWNGNIVTLNAEIEPAPNVQSVYLTPEKVQGGYTSLLTVVLDRPAPSGDLKVYFKSNLSSVFVPAHLTIAKGQTQGSILVTTQAVTELTQGVITTTLNDKISNLGIQVTR